MNLSEYISYPVVSSLVGALVGSCVTCYLNYRQNKRNFRYNQLDRLYGPVYALIQHNKLQRKNIENIIKNIWDGKCKNFIGGQCNSFDDYEVMAEGSSKDAFHCSEKIFELITSNVMFARSADMQLIQKFNQKYCEHINSFGSCEFPPIFQNYLDSTKIPVEFIDAVKNSYDYLIAKFK